MQTLRRCPFMEANDVPVDARSWGCIFPMLLPPNSFGQGRSPQTGPEKHIPAVKLPLPPTAFLQTMRAVNGGSGPRVSVTIELIARFEGTTGGAAPPWSFSYFGQFTNGTPHKPL